jgi:transposase-like protein
MNRRPGYSKEVRERAVRMVLTGEHDHSSRWATILSVASKIGCTPETLRSWVKKMEVDSGTKPGTTADQSQRTKELEREVRELKRANEILRKAAAFFAQAELDRKPRY